MFNPAAFVTAHRESFTIGNSEHPVAKHVVSLLAKPVTGRSDLWYIRTKKDTVTITYRPSDSSLCFYEFGFAKFRKHVEEKTLPNIEPINVSKEDKWLGSVIVRELVACYGF